MTIAVAILNWNGCSLLEQFLPDVIKYTPLDVADVYVIDNASDDDSLAYIEENFKSVKVIKNPVNGGYAKGYNMGLMNIKADVFCLINSDIQVTEGWLEPIIKTFKEQQNTVIAQPKILDQKQPAYFEYAGAAGGFIDSLGYPYCRGRVFNTLEKDEGQYDDECDIFWASGACLFIRSEVFWKLGALDEKYFAHQEEIDLCWRAFNAGYATKYIPSSTVYHVGGATLSHGHWHKTFYNFRNSLFNIVKNKNGNYFGSIFIRLILDAVAGVKFLLDRQPKHTWAIIKAHFSFYKNLSYIIKKRKEQPNKRPNYSNVTNVVFQYYILNNKTYRQLS